jgi:hypothetical protein
MPWKLEPRAFGWVCFIPNSLEAGGRGPVDESGSNGTTNQRKYPTRPGINLVAACLIDKDKPWLKEKPQLKFLVQSDQTPEVGRRATGIASFPVKFPVRGFCMETGAIRTASPAKQSVNLR